MWPRATLLTVAGIDVDGERREITADAFEARAFQHELDHLDGLVFLDRCEGPHAVFAAQGLQVTGRDRSELSCWAAIATRCKALERTAV